MPRWFLWSCVARGSRYSSREPPLGNDGLFSRCWNDMTGVGSNKSISSWFLVLPILFQGSIDECFSEGLKLFETASQYLSIEIWYAKVQHCYLQWSHAMAVKRRPRLVLGTEAGKDGPLVILSHSSLIVFLYVSMRKSFPSGHVWAHVFPKELNRCFAFVVQSWVNLWFHIWLCHKMRCWRICSSFSHISGGITIRKSQRSLQVDQRCGVVVYTNAIAAWSWETKRAAKKGRFRSPTTRW